MTISGTDKSLPSVPRSKGCITCVSRKSRCDGRRPTCRACEDRKQICRGYRRDDFVFLSDGWRAPGVGTTTTTTTTTTTGRKRRAAGATPVVQPQTQRRGSRALGDPAPDPDPDPGLTLGKSLALDRSTLHVAFFLSEFATPLQTPPFLMHLFRHYLSRLPPPSYQHHASSTASVLPSTPVLFAVDALAQGHFGRVSADPASIKQSFQKYGMALRAMSAQLAELNLADSGLRNLSEDNWQHIAFFCIVMMFWELKMAPQSQNWQRHIRGLVDTIVLRNSDHAYSSTNYRLLAASRLFITLQALSAKQPSGLSSHDWPSIRSAWLKEIQTVAECASGEDQQEMDLFHSLDALMEKVSAIVPIMTEYDCILANLREAPPNDGVEAGQSLANLYNQANAILHQVEGEVQGKWTTTMRETTLSEWLSSYRVADSLDRSATWIGINRDVQGLIDSVLCFNSMRDYHAVTLHWTAIISLRLLISDMLATATTTLWQFPLLLSADGEAEIERHRVELAGYTHKALQVIPYVQQLENRTLAPFLLATGFQMTTVTLERECKILRARCASEAEIDSCQRTKELVVRYMDWVGQTKILVRVDVDPLRQWVLERAQ